MQRNTCIYFSAPRQGPAEWITEGKEGEEKDFREALQAQESIGEVVRKGVG